MCLGMTGVITAIRDDDGVPMALIDTTADTAAYATADADVAASVIPACLLTCQEARVGDTVLVHSGYVLQIFDPPDPQEDQP
jgi:hydrogenase maturation factor